MRCCPYADGNTSVQTGIHATSGYLPLSTGQNLTHYFGSRDHAMQGLPLPYSYPNYVSPPRSVGHRNVPVIPGSAGVTTFGVATRSPGLPTHMQPARQGYLPLIVPRVSSFAQAQSMPNSGVKPAQTRYREEARNGGETGRPITPSPNGSDSSDCSFAFSSIGIASPASTSTLASPPALRLAEFCDGPKITPKLDGAFQDRAKLAV